MTLMAPANLSPFLVAIGAMVIFCLGYMWGWHARGSLHAEIQRIADEVHESTKPEVT